MKKTYAIGLDVGGTFLKYCLADREGKIAYSSSLPMGSFASYEEGISVMNEAIQDCLRFDIGDSEIVGVGIGFPGIVEDGIVHGGANNLVGFNNIPLEEIIKRSSGLPVVVDNDANMMGWGELMYGAAVGMTDVLFITVGTGIGGSMIINGELYGGYRNRGGEFGHIIIERNGVKCTCGSYGCLEAYASVNALIAKYCMLKNIDSTGIDGKKIIENYLLGEEEAVITMDWHFSCLSTGLIGLVNVFSPQKVVLGGGISSSGAFYIDKLRELTELRALPDAIVNTEIIAAQLGNWAGCLGSCGRVFSEIKSQ